MKGRVDPALGLGILVLLLAAAFGVLAVVDKGRLGPEPGPPMPFQVSAAVTPPDARATLIPPGGVVEPSGRLTILNVPATLGTRAPRQPGERGPDERGRAAGPVPRGMLAGIRGFYRLDPLPPEELERPITVTLEAVFNEAPLVLADGCFRFGGRHGPLAVFPPGSRFGLIDGYLVVGPPGLPARSSARVGEVIAWEGRPVRAISAAGQAKVRERCGAGEVVAVQPWSASVRQAETDSWTASEMADRLKLSFSEALELLKDWGEPARRAVRGGPLSQSLEEACRIARPQPVEPPPPPLPQPR